MRSVLDDITFALPRPRTVIRPDPAPLASIAGRTVMVTGAGGSIGAELCLQLTAMGPACLVMADQSELGLYEVNRRLLEGGATCGLFPALVDVRHDWAVNRLFLKTEPDIVFHAAALKHVPLLENDHNMVEAVRTNVLGSWNIAQECWRRGAAMVLISTDKAVNPTSVMGLTKRVAEIAVEHMATSYPGKMALGIVRFGNVFGSSGSVVPLFVKQIQQGGPVTVTHPDMTRYFMTINQAVGLVLAAGDRLSKAKTCREWLYVLDMGRPVRIMELAERLIEMSGLRVRDVGIEITGLRPGEKLTEELSYPWEKLTPLSDGIRGHCLGGGPIKVSIATAIYNIREASEKQDAAWLKTIMNKLVTR